MLRGHSQFPRVGQASCCRVHPGYQLSLGKSQQSLSSKEQTHTLLFFQSRSQQESQLECIFILGVKSPQEAALPSQATCATQNLGQRNTFSLPYTPNLCDQPGREKFSPSARDNDGGRCLPTVAASSCLRWLVSRGTSSFPKLPMLVTGGVQRVLPCGISKPQCPHPTTLPGQPVPPTQPEKCNRSSVSETLQASINKCGVSLAAAHSPGKATAAKALTWKFTQTLSGFAVRQQQNVTLLLLSLHFTNLQAPWQGHCSPVLCSPVSTRALQGQGKH